MPGNCANERKLLLFSEFIPQKSQTELDLQVLSALVLLKHKKMQPPAEEPAVPSTSAAGMKDDSEEDASVKHPFNSPKKEYYRSANLTAPSFLRTQQHVS